MRVWVCELMGLGTAVVCTVWDDDDFDDDDDDDDAIPICHICHMLGSFGVWSVLLIHAVSSC